MKIGSMQANYEFIGERKALIIPLSLNNGYAGVILCISTEVYEVHRDKINERALFNGTK